jgi:hypothetical protein
MLDVTDWLSVTEASEQSGYDAEWLRKIIRKYIKLGPDYIPPFSFVKKGQMFLIEPNSFSAYCKEMKEKGTGKHDPTRKPRRR